MPVHRTPGATAGSVFALPAELDKWRQGSGADAKPDPKDGHFCHRVLFVDDNEAIRATGKAILETQGYEVHAAEDGFDALNHLNRALPDLLITDLRMPNMSGFELLSVVRKRFPQIAVIAVSAEFLPAVSPELIVADAFVPKGEDKAALFAKIVDLIERSPLRPGVRHTETAAVWLPRSKNDYVVVTCPYCLRTSPTPQPTDEAVRQVGCPHCERTITFRMVPGDLPHTSTRNA